MFVGAAAATAFGDYVAGSNHVLPTGGAARFAARARRPPRSGAAGSVSLPGEARGAARARRRRLARAEGFPVHAESMERRA